MPAESKNQAIAARIALAAKKEGKKPKPGTASASMAKMPTKSLKHFTKAKKGAPKKKNESLVTEGNVGYEETRGGERYQMAVLDALQGEGMSFDEADTMVDIEYDLIGDCLYDDVSAETCAEMIMDKNREGIPESYRARLINEKWDPTDYKDTLDDDYNDKYQEIYDIISAMYKDYQVSQEKVVTYVCEILGNPKAGVYEDILSLIDAPGPSRDYKELTDEIMDKFYLSPMARRRLTTK